MSKINYNVKCDNSKLKKELAKDKLIIEKRFSIIVRMRKEINCYENSRNKKFDFKDEK